MSGTHCENCGRCYDNSTTEDEFDKLDLPADTSLTVDNAIEHLLIRIGERKAQLRKGLHTSSDSEVLRGRIKELHRLTNMALMYRTNVKRSSD
jgi:hypothetical protein